jgi:hypothetical protein
MFDDLHNSITDFTSCLVQHLLDLYYNEKVGKNCKDNDLFINIIIPEKKDLTFPVKNNN